MNKEIIIQIHYMYENYKRQVCLNRSSECLIFEDFLEFVMNKDNAGKQIEMTIDETIIKL